MRGSGLPVDLEVNGEPLLVPPGIDLSAYRIVQEALTNVIKHAGPAARAHVELTYGPGDLEVTVTNICSTTNGYAVRARLPYLLGSS